MLSQKCVPVVQRLGHRPFTAVTRVRIPSGTPKKSATYMNILVDFKGRGNATVTIDPFLTFFWAVLPGFTLTCFKAGSGVRDTTPSWHFAASSKNVCNRWAYRSLIPRGRDANPVFEGCAGPHRSFGATWLNATNPHERFVIACQQCIGIYRSPDSDPLLPPNGRRSGE